jgi:Uma2 family endonuclease
VSTSRRYTSADLAGMPDVPGTRYEIIDGELFVSKQPHWHHQFACLRAGNALDTWSTRTGAGMTNTAPGLVFAEDDDVAPDVVWISRERLAGALDRGGHLIVTPELVVEVLSPGAANERRDRDRKLALYARRGVEEYWIVDWRNRSVDACRRAGSALALAASLSGDEVLTSPLLPDFACPLSSLWAPLP